MGKRKQLLRAIQSIVKEKYTVGKAPLVEDLRNSVDILCDELRILYEAGGGLQFSLENLENILKENQEKLCEICCKYENNKYMTLEKILETADYELNKVICDKELQIYTILASMMFSKINELEELLDCDMEDIEKLEIEQITDIVSISIDKLVNEFADIEEKTNYFDKIICYIGEEIEEIV